jgi:hypothetical protein
MSIDAVEVHEADGPRMGGDPGEHLLDEGG